MILLFTMIGAAGAQAGPSEADAIVRAVALVGSILAAGLGLAWMVIQIGGKVFAPVRDLVARVDLVYRIVHAPDDGGESLVAKVRDLHTRLKAVEDARSTAEIQALQASLAQVPDLIARLDQMADAAEERTR